MLRDRGVPFDSNVSVGMIEIPAAALAIVVPGQARFRFDRHQRSDPVHARRGPPMTRSPIFDPLHPTVLKLIGYAIAAANKAKVPIAVRRRNGGRGALDKLLLGLGLRSFRSPRICSPSSKGCHQRCHRDQLIDGSVAPRSRKRW
jgi:phosphotransferase system enzyme I (PtsI)